VDALKFTFFCAVAIAVAGCEGTANKDLKDVFEGYPLVQVTPVPNGVSFSDLPTPIPGRTVPKQMTGNNDMVSKNFYCSSIVNP
jgi:hypothetical protein